MAIWESLLNKIEQQANEALEKLRKGQISGAAVLVMDAYKLQTCTVLQLNQPIKSFGYINQDRFTN